MTTIEQTTTGRRPDTRAIDMDALMQFVGSFVGDLGATMGAGNVLLGERLGLYRGLAAGPADARELATQDRHRPALRGRVAARAGRRRLRRSTTPAARRTR